MDYIVKKSKIREHTSLSVSEEFIDDFNQRVYRLLDDCESRAKKDERATLMARDV